MSAPAFTRHYADHVARLQSAYARCLAAHGYDAVVVHGGLARKRSEFDDQWWSLRPTPHFQHWVPVAEPDAALVIVPGATPLLARVRADNFWERPAAPESDHWAQRVAQVTLDATSSLRSHIPSGRVAFVGEDLAAAAAWGLADVNPAGLVRDLDALRTRKTPYEVDCLVEANRRAAAGHAAVRDAFAAGAETEFELHLAYLRATGQDDPETPYKNIVAMGRNAATLHHIAYERRPAGEGGAQTLLLDAGATCLGYCSDITRTWVRGPASAARDAWGALVEGMESLQRTVCAEVTAGRGYESLHDRAHDHLGALLARVGVLRCSGGEAVAKGVTRVFLPHGLGHSLGLQCHDVGCAVVKPRADNPFLRNTSKVEVGQVFTIEPGVYFIDGLLRGLREGPHASLVEWDLVGRLAPLGGVRIEDDVVVTGDAPGAIRNVTREFLPTGGATVD